MLNTNQPEASKQPETLTFAHRGAGDKLVFDNRAWEMAKIACGPDAILADIIERANRIKATLTEGM